MVAVEGQARPNGPEAWGLGSRRQDQGGGQAPAHNPHGAEADEGLGMGWHLGCGVWPSCATGAI